MPASVAISSFGTLFKRNGTTITEVGDISFGEKLNTVEATNHSSPSGWKEYLGTVLEGGSPSFSINFLPTDATHSDSAGLISDLKGKTLQTFTIVLTDSGAMTVGFSAFVTSIDISAPVEGKLTANISLLISGPVTWTP